MASPKYRSTLQASNEVTIFTTRLTKFRNGEAPNFVIENNKLIKVNFVSLKRFKQRQKNL